MTFAFGNRVLLQHLKTRSQLNGTIATVEGWNQERARYVVCLPTGERIRVRSHNVTHPPSKPSNATGSNSTDIPNEPSSSRRKEVDPTLYLANQQFIQPAVPAAPATENMTTAGPDYADHRLSLPAGHWDVRLLEQNGVTIIVTLVAEKKMSAGDNTRADDSAWNELCGLRITRTVHGCDGDNISLQNVTTTVEGSVLTVSVPMANAEEAGYQADSVEPVAESESAPGRSEWLNQDGFVAQKIVDPDFAEGSETERDYQKENLFANVEYEERFAHSSDTAKLDRKLNFGNACKTKRSVLHCRSVDPTSRRCRKHSQALRRVESARHEWRRFAHDKACAQPTWKAARGRTGEEVAA
mmetsp:Transcript_21779/g.35972  ORF Transcript_21779/g.35972 Transcript_21779/m.35972 type:complete len:355 (+) Transcript_21779:26-1090(+)